MHIVIAAGQLKAGVTEEALLAASDRFQNEFLVKHPGAVRRLLVADQSGGYADIVLFSDEAAIEQLMAAEQTSEVAHEFLGLWGDVEPMVYQVLRTHG
jgi:hypothetical protein